MTKPKNEEGSTVRTYSPKPGDVQRQWYVIDAEDVVLGRLASHVAQLLRGKHKPVFAPHVDTGDFVVARCRDCGGVLKPHVVFFGENVPVERVERCYAAVDRLPETEGALLVAGSSLTVMSGFRFVRRAARAGTPVVIVNRGATRGDDLATYRLDTGTSEFLTALAARRG